MVVKVILGHMQGKRADADAGKDQAAHLLQMGGVADRACQPGAHAQARDSRQRIPHAIGLEADGGMACTIGQTQLFTTKKRMAGPAEKAKEFTIENSALQWPKRA